MNLQECNICFLDTETGGLDPDRHALLEVGVVKVTPQLEPVAEFETLVCPPPTVLVDRSALDVNKLDLTEVRAKGMGEAAVADTLSRFLTDTLIVGHNIGFDWAFLRALFSRTGTPMPVASYHRIDTVSLAWPLLLAGRVTRLNLNALCEHFGVPNEGQHRALADARRTFQVYRKIMAEYQAFAGWV